LLVTLELAVELADAVREAETRELELALPLDP
jgi:hypothetical protein